MASSGSDGDYSEASTSDGEPLLAIERLPMLLPLCRCHRQNLCTLFWMPGEPIGRCYECLNRVDVGRLTPEERFAYLTLRLLWAAQFCRPV